MKYSRFALESTLGSALSLPRSASTGALKSMLFDEVPACLGGLADAALRVELDVPAAELARSPPTPIGHGVGGLQAGHQQVLEDVLVDELLAVAADVVGLDLQVLEVLARGERILQLQQLRARAQRERQIRRARLARTGAAARGQRARLRHAHAEGAQLKPAARALPADVVLQVRVERIHVLQLRLDRLARDRRPQAVGVDRGLEVESVLGDVAHAALDVLRDVAAVERRVIEAQAVRGAATAGRAGLQAGQQHVLEVVLVHQLLLLRRRRRPRSPRS